MMDSKRTKPTILEKSWLVNTPHSQIEQQVLRFANGVERKYRRSVARGLGAGFMYPINRQPRNTAHS